MKHEHIFVAETVSLDKFNCWTMSDILSSQYTDQYGPVRLSRICDVYWYLWPSGQNVKELNPKHSGQLTGSADDVVLLEKLHSAVDATNIVINHLPPNTRANAEK